MKRLCLFWRKNKGLFSVVEIRFDPRLLPSGSVFHCSLNFSENHNGRLNILKNRKKENDLAKTIYLQTAVHCCFIPILSHYSLFSHCAACQPEEKSPVSLITAPGLLLPLRNGSNLGFGSESLLGYK